MSLKTENSKCTHITGCRRNTSLNHLGSAIRPKDIFLLSKKHLLPKSLVVGFPQAAFQAMLQFSKVVLLFAEQVAENNSNRLGCRRKNALNQTRKALRPYFQLTSSRILSLKRLKGRGISFLTQLFLCSTVFMLFKATFVSSETYSVYYYIRIRI